MNNKLIERMNKNSSKMYREFNNKTTSIKYELMIKYDNDFKLIQCKDLQELILQAYKAELNDESYQIELSVCKGKNVIIEDGTDAIMYWNTENEQRVKKENEILQNELNMYKEFLNKYNLNKEFEKF